MNVRYGQKRVISFSPDLPDPEATLLGIVVYFTGDLLKPIECDKIMSAETNTKWEFVYFGKSESLADPESGFTQLYEELKKASVTERFDFNDEVQFFTNSDPECAKKHKLRLSVQNALLFGRQVQDPEVQEAEPGEMTAESILRMINVGLARESKKWNKRTYNAIFEYNQNALIYMDTDKAKMPDWLSEHISELVETSRTQQVGTLVPVIAGIDDKFDLANGEQQISDLLEINQEDLPELFAFHAPSKKQVSYPSLLDELKEKTPK